MAKGKRKKRSYRRKAKTYRKKARRTVPFEVVIAGGAIPFVKSHPNNSLTPFEAAKQGDWEYVMRSLMEGFTPINWYGNEINVIDYINPFSMNKGIYMKMLLLGGISSKIRKRFVKIPFDKVPIVGKYIS